MSLRMARFATEEAAFSPGSPAVRVLFGGLAKGINMDQKRNGCLAVEMRPQISVETSEFGEVVISTVGVSDDFERVEFNDIHIPFECASDVANAILKMVSSR